MIGETKNLISRSPVVVILGHVDHGKTSLLDRIRETKVAEKESGGITQHIGAYEVSHPLKTPSQTPGQVTKKITFIDTPGHEAFSAMRGRGVNLADIAILVVAADEGVKPQTKEAINWIKKAGIPSIVALNKIDKSEADPERIKGELAENGMIVEKLGGKIPLVETSAKTGQGIDELLEVILLVAEMENLKAEVSKPAEGVIIESYLDPLRGPSATLLLQQGILKIGDIIGTKSTSGKTKNLFDFRLKPIEEASPSMPVVVLGFENCPIVGESFETFVNLEAAKKYLEKKEKKSETREVFFVEPGKNVLNIILKADVLGSLEALSELLKNLPQDKVILRVLKKDVGEINETDLKLAVSSRAKIFGFRVKINPLSLALNERLKIKIFLSDIVYDFVSHIRQAIEKMTIPEIVKEIIGKVRILAIFLQEKNRQIIGGKVIEGEIKREGMIEILRDEERIGEGKIISLQQNKRDVEKVIKDQECGILFEGNVKIEKGDILILSQEKKIK